MKDPIERRDAIDAVLKLTYADGAYGYADAKDLVDSLENMPSAKPEEVIPHRNYKYLSDYWCECGWNLGKKGEVKYCSNCGRKVNWDG